MKDVVEIKVGYDGIVHRAKQGRRLAEPHAQGRLPGAGEDRSGPGQSELADSEPVHHLEGRQQVAARREDRSARARRRLPARAIRSPSCTWKRAAATSPGSTRCVPRTSRASSVPATAIREDGSYIEAGENDNLIVQKLGANKDAVGHLRLQLPRGEPRQAQRRRGRRRFADLRDGGLGQVSGVAPACSSTSRRRTWT